ncbi:MAG: beta-propeller domain-containing protein [Candidatus Woesearchaeota archaeon]
MKNTKPLMIGILIVVIVLAAIMLFLLLQPSPEQTVAKQEDSSFKKFSSPREFYEVLSSRESTGYYYFGAVRTQISAQTKSIAEPVAMSKDMSESYVQETPERYSETNIQVLGIDEPDIVKTDGNNIYYSIERWYRPVILERRPDYIMPPNYYERNTFVINALPVQSLSIKNKINYTGNLLLTDNSIIVLGNDGIRAFSKSTYEKKWNLKYNSSYFIDARMYNNKLYVILGKYLYYFYPEEGKCLLSPIEGFSVKCTNIYYPRTTIPLETSYFVLKINPETGEIEDETTFLAPSYNTQVYMSENNLFITIHYQKTFYEITKNFILENKDYFDNNFISRVEKLDSYEISESSKMNELSLLLSSYLASFDEDKRLEFENRMNDYTKKNKKEIYKTRIAKISVNDLEFKETTDIPGKVLNQFSMDEYNNYFRIAVTIGETWSGDSENAIYILDENLKVVGKTESFGLTERIYSVRFIGDKAYVVTFRETDPFYIMDLSNPEKPEIKGELKIPGYSSYLHPINDNFILGIGKEGSEIKVSLFDVSNVEKPSEVDKFVLSEYWSDILNTHRAFLIDRKHEIFFLPGSKGGYVLFKQ